MRSVLVVSFVLLPLLAGCLTAGEEPEPIETEPEPEPVAEPWTRRLFLLFPDPCPENAAGNTTYNTSMEATPSRECGKGIADATTTPLPCASFFFHDPEYRLYKGQRVAAYVEMEYGPGPTEIRLAWMDDEGVVAEGMDGTLAIIRGLGFAEAETTVQRDSTTGLRFEIHAENFSCGKIAVGSNGSRASAIWVEEDD